MPVPIISCLMVTRGDLTHVQRAIQCFLSQTMDDTELVIVEDRGTRLKEYVASLNNPRFRYEAVLTTNHTLGDLRNLSLDLARGEFVAIWDDDDWYHPARLSLQLGYLKQNRADGCALARLTSVWPAKQKVFYTNSRLWENSLLSRRSFNGRYPALPKGEDTKQVDSTIRNGAKICWLNAPDLYLYHIHGANTMDDAHFEEHVNWATEIPVEQTRNAINERLN